MKRNKELSDNGLDKKEQKVLDHITKAWNCFIKLERQHPDEIDEFKQSIHSLQDQMSLRAVRRQFPKGWPSYHYDKQEKKWIK